MSGSPPRENPKNIMTQHNIEANTQPVIQKSQEEEEEDFEIDVDDEPRDLTDSEFNKLTIE
jgi:hypothetical protein